MPETDLPLGPPPEGWDEWFKTHMDLCVIEDEAEVVPARPPVGRVLLGALGYFMDEVSAGLSNVVRYLWSMDPIAQVFIVLACLFVAAYVVGLHG